MKKILNNNGLQMTTLVVLRMLIGWHMFYEGIVKLLSPGWSSASFLGESQWILSGFSNWVTSNPDILSVVDFLNIWGLIAIGAGLILGLFSRTAALAGTLLLLVYYFNNPPFIGLEYSVPMEGNYLVVSKTLIEAVALFLIAIFPSSHIFGLDLFVNKLKKRN